ncbi:MAG: hypothetical protein QM775_02935 [Pirellulales bacterium]
MTPAAQLEEQPIPDAAAARPAKPAAAKPAAPAKPKQPTAPPPRQDEPDLPVMNFTARFVTSPEEAESLVPAWQRLVQTAIEPNAFYEPWSLLPAWRHLAGDDAVQLLVVEAPKRVLPTGPKVLCGLFPILRRRRFYGLPASCWELWRHVHCFLTTPLVRRDCAREVVDCFFHAAATDSQGAAVVHAEMLPAEGPLHRTLVEANFEAGRTTFQRELSTRASFAPRPTPRRF